jgi:hypothetical protein
MAVIQALATGSGHGDGRGALLSPIRQTHRAGAAAAAAVRGCCALGHTGPSPPPPLTSQHCRPCSLCHRKLEEVAWKRLQTLFLNAYGFDHAEAFLQLEASGFVPVRAHPIAS